MMVNKKYSVKDYFRHENENKLPQDPANDFNIIPSWNKEFACLVGLEVVVQFRLERLDKTEYTAPNRCGTRGRQKKFPIPAVIPPALTKDPNTCTICNTDVSCSWKCDMNNSLLCHNCFKCSWRKDHWLFDVPRETIIKSTSDNASITFTSQAVANEPQSLQPSSHSISQECYKQVPNNSVSSFSDCYPDSPFYSSSSFPSDFSSSLPEYFSDTSSHGSSSFSPDYHCSCIYCASSSCVSSLCESSSPLYLPASSDLNSSSSVSPSPDSSPPNNSTKKVKVPYYMETPVVMALFKDDKAKQKLRKEKDEQTQYKEERMNALSVPSPLSNQHILFKTQSVLPDSEPSLLSIGEHQLQTQIFFSASEKVPSSVSVSGNVRQQDSRSIPGCSQESIIGTNVQHCKAQAHTSSSLISSPSTHMSVSFQTTSSTNQGRAEPQKKVKWEATSNQKIDKWIQKPKTSMGSQGSYPF